MNYAAAFVLIVNLNNTIYLSSKSAFTSNGKVHILNSNHMIDHVFLQFFYREPIDLIFRKRAEGQKNL